MRRCFLSAALVLCLAGTARAIDASDLYDLCAGLGQSAKAMTELRDQGISREQLIAAVNAQTSRAKAVMLTIVDSIYANPKLTPTQAYEDNVSLCLRVFGPDVSPPSSNGPALEIPQTKENN